MAKIDRKAMKQKLLKRTKKSATRKSRAGAGIFRDDLEGVNFWSCKEGDHIIDIIPYPAGSMDPETAEGDPTYNFEFFVHRDVGPTEDQRVICLAETYGEACPICEHRRQLQKEGADDDSWKPLFAKQRNIYNIVCYDTEKEEERGVQVWEVAWFYMEKHLAKLSKGPMQRGKNRSSNVEPNIAFADPDEGRSICFSVEKQGKEFPEFGGHQFEQRDYQIDDAILEEAHSLDELVIKPTYEEVYELYWGEAPEGSSSKKEDSEETDEDDGVIKNTRSSRTKSSSNKSAGRGRKVTPKEEPEETEEVEETEEADTDEVECPIGGRFAEDFDGFEECEQCKIWDDCQAASRGDVEEEQEEQEEEKPAKPTRRGTARRGSGGTAKKEAPPRRRGRR